MRDDSLSRDPLPVFSAGGHCGQNWHGYECPPSISSANHGVVQGAVKGGFGKAVVARDMPEPCEFPSLEIGRSGSCGSTKKYRPLSLLNRAKPSS